MIEVSNVTKHFGKQTVLDDVSAQFESGQIHGIVGRNGSGKTVLFKMICGLMKPDSGRIRIDAKEIGKDIEMPHSVGIIINSVGFIPNLSARRNLMMLARIRNQIHKKQVDQAIISVGLNPSSRKHVSRYSTGMRQRLGIAQAIMEDPELLILDEPFNGLDDGGVRDIRDLLLQLKAQGKTILMSSHNPLDITLLCDNIYQISSGHLKRMSSLEDWNRLE